jgi:hypothetical protein
MLLVTPAVAGLEFLCLKTLQMLAQRSADQRRTLRPRLPGSPIGGIPRGRIPNNLNRFHTAQYMPHATQHSIARCTQALRCES